MPEYKLKVEIRACDHHPDKNGTSQHFTTFDYCIPLIKPVMLWPEGLADPAWMTTPFLSDTTPTSLQIQVPENNKNVENWDVHRGS